MTPIEEVAAIEAIRRLKARYCRLFDTKQWDALREVFTADAGFEGFTSMPDGSPPAVFIDAVSKRMARAVTVHRVTAPEIRMLGPDHARGIWAMVDYVQFLRDGRSNDAKASRGWKGWGYYIEEYVRQDGSWRICFMRLDRHRIDDLPADYPEPRPVRTPPTHDWL